MSKPTIGRGRSLMDTLSSVNSTNPNSIPNPNLRPGSVSTSATRIGRGRTDIPTFASPQPVLNENTLDQPKPSTSRGIGRGFDFNATNTSRGVGRGLDFSAPSTSHGIGRGSNSLKSSTNSLYQSVNEPIKSVKEKPKYENDAHSSSEIEAASPYMKKSFEYENDAHSSNETDTASSYVKKPREIHENKEPVKRLGTSGNQVDVSANYLRLSFKGGHGAFEYRVNFIPEIDHKAFRIKMLREHSKTLGKDLVYDGQTLYLPEKLNDEATVLHSKHPVENSKITIKVVFVKERDFSQMVHIFNVLFKRIMATLNLVRIGRDCFNLDKSISIPQHKLKVLPGYVTAVNVYEDGLMLNLDPSHKVIRTQTVLNEINDLKQVKSVYERNSNTVKDYIASALRGKSVITQYNGKLYTIDDIDFNRNPLSKFTQNSGESISFLDYYRNQYQKEILDLDQPLLISRHVTKKSNPTLEKTHDEKLICLVPELCNMTGLSDDMRENTTLMKDLSRYMKISPNIRYQSLKDYVTNITSNVNAKSILDNWGLSIDPLPVTLSARELKPENINFGKSKSIMGTSDAEWNRGVMTNPVITPVDLNNWTILYTKKDVNNVKEFCKTVMTCGQGTGIVVSQPKLILLPSDKTEVYVSYLKKEINPYLQLVVCVCPSSRDDRYAAIKKACCVEHPIPSQVINGFTLSKSNKLRAVSHKILLQMNCKLGGTLWSVAIPYTKLMVIGLDVYHSAGHGSQSVCGFVASYNQSLTRWYSRVCFQKPGQEIVDQLKICFMDSIQMYLTTNGCLPDRIIVYRDGVGDGQFNVCKDYEVPQIVSYFKCIDKTYEPMFTYVIVQKRNNTRIFTSPLQRGPCNNPNPGTVIDNTVTRRYLYDFYVVSHKAREGSLVPTHYVVIYDSSNMEPDHMQRMTFKMCHLYFNWPGTVRVPAPCQYAHKLAFLIGSSVKSEHDICLANRLFFL